jgi:hypothetical protein
LAYRVSGWTFVLGNQFGFYEGVDVEIGNYQWQT